MTFDIIKLLNYGALWMRVLVWSPFTPQSAKGSWKGTAKESTLLVLNTQYFTE